MAKAMGVSPITDTIYYGNLKNDKWVGKKGRRYQNGNQGCFRVVYAQA